MYVIFNDSKEFVGYSPDQIPQMLSKEIPAEFKNLLEYKWVGNYEDGKMIPSIPNILEPDDQELAEERKTFELMSQRYPLGVQLTYIIQQLYDLVKNEDVKIQNPYFMDMAEFILPAIEKRDKRLKYKKQQ
jgi:hypothetical protein